jgi:hypothetical protein
MAEKQLEIIPISRAIISIKSAFFSNKQLMFLGLSSSLTAGAAYSHIISINSIYFTPALGIFAGLVGGMGAAVRDILSEKRKFDDIHLKDLTTYAVFGITGLFLGYIFVYYFVKLPLGSHGTAIPAELETIHVFFKNTMGIPDILGAIFGSICSAAIPILFKEKIKYLMEKIKN